MHTCSYMCLLTTWNFLEVDKLGVRSHLLTGRDVGVHVALLQPRVVVSREAVRSHFTRFLTVFRLLKLSEHLGTAGYVETFVDGYGLL